MQWLSQLQLGSRVVRCQVGVLVVSYPATPDVWTKMIDEVVVEGEVVTMMDNRENQQDGLRISVLSCAL